MKAYSQDLRKRILDTVQRGEGTLLQIARRFLVSVSFITRLLQRHRSTGSDGRLWQADYDRVDESDLQEVGDLRRRLRGSLGLPEGGRGVGAIRVVHAEDEPVAERREEVDPVGEGEMDAQGDRPFRRAVRAEEVAGLEHHTMTAP